MMMIVLTDAFIGCTQKQYGRKEKYALERMNYFLMTSIEQSRLDRKILPSFAFHTQLIINFTCSQHLTSFLFYLIIHLRYILLRMLLLLLCKTLKQ